MKRFIYGSYSWITNVGWMILDLMPEIIRRIVFKFMLGSFGKGSYIDYGTYIRYMKQVSIGTKVWINRGCKFFCSHYYKGARLTIGDHTAIAPNVTFLAAGHNYNDIGLANIAGSIEVGRNVWIGANSTIIANMEYGPVTSRGGGGSCHRRRSDNCRGSRSDEECSPLERSCGSSGKSDKTESVDWFAEKLRTENLTFKEGIYYASNVEAGDISYDDEGHNVLFELEDKSWWFKHRNKLILAGIEKFKPRNSRIIEVGAGNGNTTKFLVHNGFQTAMFEPGNLGCINAKRRGMENIVCGLFGGDTVKSNCVESIGIFDVLEHIKDDRRFLEGFGEQLEAGGLLYITVPAHKWLWSDSDDCGHFRRYNLGTLYEVVAASGYEVLYSTYFCWLLLPVIWLFRRLPYVLRNKTKTKTIKRYGFVISIFADKIVNRMLAGELRCVSNGNRCLFGASIFMVARKKL